jgi:hypothetical protein
MARPEQGARALHRAKTEITRSLQAQIELPLFDPRISIELARTLPVVSGGWNWHRHHRYRRGYHTTGGLAPKWTSLSLPEAP